MYETMLHLGLHENLNTDLWPECAATMTKIEKNMVNPHEENVPTRCFYGKIPDYAKHL